MLNKDQIAFLIRYSDAEKFCCSLENIVEPLLRQKLLEVVYDRAEGEYYKVSNFGLWLVDKLVNLANAYEVQTFKLTEENDGVSAPLELITDNSHYAEEVDEDLWDEIQEITEETGMLDMLYANDEDNDVLDIDEPSSY